MILYLHGFLSSPLSAKAKALEERCRSRQIPFTCPALPLDPAAALGLAEQIITRETSTTPPAITLVGSSLGGHYATWLAEKYGVKAVLVNPAVVAHLSLEKYLGPQTNLYSGEQGEFTPAHIATLRATQTAQITRPERYWLLAETGDEVLDYRQAVARYEQARQDILPGGDHRFTRWHDYLDAIIDFAQAG